MAIQLRSLLARFSRRGRNAGSLASRSAAARISAAFVASISGGTRTWTFNARVTDGAIGLLPILRLHDHECEVEFVDGSRRPRRRSHGRPRRRVRDEAVER